jgi:hypothetical protein
MKNSKRLFLSCHAKPFLFVDEITKIDENGVEDTIF